MKQNIIASITDLDAKVNEIEKQLENLRLAKSVYNTVKQSMLADVGTWNSDKGEYELYTIEEVEKGETVTGKTIWMEKDEYIARLSAYNRALNAILNI